MRDILLERIYGIELQQESLLRSLDDVTYFCKKEHEGRNISIIINKLQEWQLLNQRKEEIEDLLQQISEVK